MIFLYVQFELFFYYIVGLSDNIDFIILRKKIFGVFEKKNIKLVLWKKKSEVIKLPEIVIKKAKNWFNHSWKIN